MMQSSITEMQSCEIFIINGYEEGLFGRINAKVEVSAIVDLFEGTITSLCAHTL